MVQYPVGRSQIQRAIGNRGRGSCFPGTKDHVRAGSGGETGTKSAPAKPNGSHPQDDGSTQGPPNPPLKFKLEKLNRDHPYFEQRGITQETVIDFGLGYFTGDKGLMVGRIVIPITNVKGEVVAYAGRWPGEPPNADTPKYKLPTGFRKGQEVFNIGPGQSRKGAASNRRRVFRFHRNSTSTASGTWWP